MTDLVHQAERGAIFDQSVDAKAAERASTRLNVHVLRCAYDEKGFVLVAREWHERHGKGRLVLVELELEDGVGLLQVRSATVPYGGSDAYLGDVGNSDARHPAACLCSRKVKG